MNLTALIGIGCLGAYVLDRLIRRPIDRHVVTVGILSGLALVVNPHHVNIFFLIFKYLNPDSERRKYIFEWMSPNWSENYHIPFGIALVLLAPAAWVLIRKRPWLYPAAPLVVLAYQSLQSIRYIPIYIMLSLVFIGWLNWKQAESRNTVPALSGKPLIPLRPWVLAPPIAAAALAVLIVNSADTSQLRREPIAWGHPVGAASYYLKYLQGERMFNTYDFGSHLIYRFLGTDNKVYIDGREEMYGEDRVRTYFYYIYGREGWEKYFDEQGINVVIIRTMDGLFPKISRVPRLEARLFQRRPRRQREPHLHPRGDALPRSRIGSRRLLSFGHTVARAPNHVRTGDRSMARSRRTPKTQVATAPRIPPPEAAATIPAAAPVETAEPFFALPAVSIRGLSDRAVLTFIILTGTIIRLAIAPWGRYLTDSQVMAFRAERMAELPINQLYLTNSGVISHLPGDLWFLWYVSNIYKSLAPNGDFGGDTFLYLTKVVPIMADAGVALALFLIARDFAGPKAGLLAAGLYAFNPGPIIISSLWDQWDSISTCFALFALWLFLRNRYELAAASITYATLVKPQFALFGLLFAIVFVRRLIFPVILPYLRSDAVQVPPRALLRPLARAAAAILAAWVTAEAVLLPFNVSIPPLSATFDLRDRLEYVFRVHDETTLNAFNFWATPWAGNAVEDYELTFIGITARSWGQFLLGVALIYILFTWWRRNTDRAIVWAALAMTFASFMLPTRIHERYMLPTVALALLAAAIQPRLLWFAAALTATLASTSPPSTSWPTTLRAPPSSTATTPA